MDAILKPLFSTLVERDFTVLYDDDSNILNVIANCEEGNSFRQIGTLTTPEWYNFAPSNVKNNPLVFEKVIFKNILINDAKCFTWFLTNGINTEWINCHLYQDADVVDEIKQHYNYTKNQVASYGATFHKGYVDRLELLNTNPSYQLNMVELLKELDLYKG